MASIKYKAFNHRNLADFEFKIWYCIAFVASIPDPGSFPELICKRRSFGAPSSAPSIDGKSAKKIHPILQALIHKRLEWSVQFTHPYIWYCHHWYSMRCFLKLVFFSILLFSFLSKVNISSSRSFFPLEIIAKPWRKGWGVSEPLNPPLATPWVMETNI